MIALLRCPGLSDCLFCKIVEGKIPAKIVHQDADTIAFEDIDPQAPVHLLVVPRKHVATLNDLAPEDDALAGKLLRVAAKLAKERGAADRGWRATGIGVLPGLGTMWKAPSRGDARVPIPTARSGLR